MTGERPQPEPTRAREHLANERTLLAWVRTGIALMGLGFVVARFGLFLRQLLALRLGGSETEVSLSGVIGIALVGVGVLAVVLSTVRFFRARAQIERGSFEPEYLVEVLVVGLTVVGGVALIVYLALTR